MESSRTYAQQSRELSREEREASRRRADLCRRDPACFARVVRRSDWYEANGWPRVEALRQAAADYGV